MPNRVSVLLNPNTCCLALALVFVSLTAAQRILANVAYIARVHHNVVHGLKASELLDGRTDFRGDAQAPYTLVEFGDFQCPPCRRTEAMLPEILRRNSSRVKLDFREFPLVSIHQYAYSAAIAAECARNSGYFWQIHDRLFTTIFTDNTSAPNVLRQSGEVYDPSAVVKRQIEIDKTLAERIPVRGTPTFVLCCPDGTVLRITSLDDLQTALD